MGKEFMAFGMQIGLQKAIWNRFFARMKMTQKDQKNLLDP